MGNGARVRWSSCGTITARVGRTLLSVNTTPVLLHPLLEGKADVVYGSRFLGGAPHRVLYFWHYVAKRKDRFDFEPEITVKIAKRRLRVYKVGISGSRELRGRRHPRQSEDSCAFWTLLPISAPVSFGTVSYLQPSHTRHTSIEKVGGA